MSTSISPSGRRPTSRTTASAPCARRPTPSGAASWRWRASSSPRSTASSGRSGAAEPDSEVARGLELVHGELIGTLGRAGVEAFDPAGERFDPAHSEVISTAPAADGTEPGTVVETVERGYRSDGTVLRPARVIVSE